MRETFLRLPGGVSEAAAVAQLRQSAAGALGEAEELKGRVAPRPSPSQYPALARSVAAFVGGAGSAARLLALLAELQVGRVPLPPLSATTHVGASAVHVAVRATGMGLATQAPARVSSPPAA